MTARFFFTITALLAAACHEGSGIGDVDPTRCPTYVNGSPNSSPAMPILGCGAVVDRYTAEIAVRGSLAYTSTWGQRQAAGNLINVWDVSANTPVLVDSVVVGSGVITTGDVAVTDDGRWLIAPTEYCNGSLSIMSLSNPRHPTPGTQFSTSEMAYGVHTAEVGRVNGTLYGFLA